MRESVCVCLDRCDSNNLLKSRSNCNEGYICELCIFDTHNIIVTQYITVVYTSKGGRSLIFTGGETPLMAEARADPPPRGLALLARRSEANITFSFSSSPSLFLLPSPPALPL